MKMLSLQTKKHVLGWSVGLGVIINYIIFYFFYYATTQLCYDAALRGRGCILIMSYPLAISFGWPFKFLELHSYAGEDFSLTNPMLFHYGFWLNAVFWILVSFAVLSLVRYFRKRKQSLPS